MKSNGFFCQFSILLVIILNLFSCGDDSVDIQESEINFFLPAELRVNPSAAIEGWITIDGNTPIRMNINLAAHTASVSKGELSRDWHTIEIEFKYTYSGNTAELATASQVVNLGSGDASIKFYAKDYNINYDSDNDGITNIEEINKGTNPFGLKPISSFCFPLDISNNSGSLVFDYDGNLLIANQTDSVESIDHKTCQKNNVATIPDETLSTVVEDKFREKLYASGVNTIYEINPKDGISRIVVTDVGNITSMLLIPPGFGNYGEKLIAGKSNGDILVVDQLSTSQTPTRIATISSALVSAMAFDKNGVLYAADYNGRKIVTVSAVGLVEDFFTSLVFPVGLAMDDTRSRLFVADSGNDSVFSIDVTNKTGKKVGSINFSAGPAQSGIAYNDESLVMITDQSQLQSQIMTPFNTSCLPLAVPNTISGIASFSSYLFNNMLISSYSTDQVLILNRRTCTLETLASNVSGHFLLGITYDHTLGLIFVGATDNNSSHTIYSIDPSDGSSNLVATVAKQPNGLTLAPAGFGAYAGQLIVGLANGEIYALNHTQTTPTQTKFATLAGSAVSDLIFGPDGTLYAAGYGVNSIFTVAPNGTTTVVADGSKGLNRPDGLAIDNIKGLLFVTNAGDDTLRQVTIPGGVVSDLGSMDFGIGFFPSGIYFDPYGSIITGLGENSLTLSFTN